jgi:hypothetical protein
VALRPALRVAISPCFATGAQAVPEVKRFVDHKHLPSPLYVAGFEEFHLLPSYKKSDERYIGTCASVFEGGLAPQGGLEPPTRRLTAGRSAN